MQLNAADRSTPLDLRTVKPSANAHKCVAIKVLFIAFTAKPDPLSPTYSINPANA